MPTNFRFHGTHHAAMRAVERGLSTENLKNVVRYPDSKIKRPARCQHGGQVFEFAKEVDGQTLICIAEVKNADCWIITGYYA